MKIGVCDNCRRTNTGVGLWVNRSVSPPQDTYICRACFNERMSRAFQPFLHKETPMRSSKWYEKAIWYTERAGTVLVIAAIAFVMYAGVSYLSEQAHAMTGSGYALLTACGLVVLATGGAVLLTYWDQKRHEALEREGPTNATQDDTGKAGEVRPEDSDTADA